jgi:hypothetical protein
MGKGVLSEDIAQNGMSGARERGRVEEKEREKMNGWMDGWMVGMYGRRRKELLDSQERCAHRTSAIRRREAFLLLSIPEAGCKQCEQ